MVMLGAIAVKVVGLFAGTLVVGHASLTVLWFVLGSGYSTAHTPSDRLLRRSSSSEDRRALFAAQLALSHACWLLFIPRRATACTPSSPIDAQLIRH